MTAYTADISQAEAYTSSLVSHNLLSKGAISGLIGAMAVTYLTEVVLPDYIWRKHAKTEVSGDGGEWLAFGGLGLNDADLVVRDLGNALLAPIDSMNYASKGASHSDVGAALDRYNRKYFNPAQDPKKQLNIIGHSMGTFKALKAGEACVRKGVSVPEFGTIVAISSPISEKDTHMGDAARVIGRVPAGGVLAKLAVEFLSAEHSARFTPSALVPSTRTAITSLFNDLSPKLWRGMLKELSGPGFDIEAIKTFVTPNTQIIHFGDENDDVVRMDRARDSYDRFAHATGASIKFVDTPGIGHANVAGVRPYVVEALQLARAA